MSTTLVGPATAARRERLKQLILELSDETYDYRRIHAALQRSGHACSLELVRALERQLGLVHRRPRPWRHSPTDQDTAPGSIPDLLDRDDSAGEQSPQDSAGRPHAGVGRPGGYRLAERSERG